MAQQLEKEIYIPRRLEKTSFKWLPLSTKLLSFFTQNKISLIGDLGKVSGELLNKILTEAVSPFPELRHYILAFQESSNNEIHLINIERAVSREDNLLDAEDSARQSSKIEQILSRTIFIPLPARKWAISYLPISSRLIEKLEKCQYLKLNDLNGTIYSRFTAVKSFEQKDILDLYIFLSQLQSEKVFPSIEKSVLKAISKAEQSAKASSTRDIEQIPNSGGYHQVLQNNLSKREVIETPASLKALPIEHLAPSNKLKTAFRKEKLLMVGQLNGLSYFELQEKLKLNEADIRELKSLIKFANKFGRYTTFASGFENIQKAALKRKENEANDSSVSGKVEKSFSKSGGEEKPFESIGKQTQTKQSNLSQIDPSATQKFVVPLFSNQNFVVPNFLKAIPISKFDLPISLVSTFDSLGVRMVGDLERVSFKDFRKTTSHTADGEVSFRKFLLQIENLKPQISDVPTEQVQDEPKTFNSAALMRNINDFISRLPALDKDIFLDRLSGISGEKILAFEAIAHKNEISRERSYQIFHRTLNKFKETLQNRAAETLEKLRDECFTMVCPLTPKFLVNLVNQDYELFQYTVEFYIRLFGSLCPQLPILPKIENQVISLNAGAKKFEQKIIGFLENQSLPVSLPEVFNQIMIYGLNRENIENDFFEAIQSTKFILMATDNPKVLFIELSWAA